MPTGRIGPPGLSLHSTTSQSETWSLSALATTVERQYSQLSNEVEQSRVTASFSRILYLMQTAFGFRSQGKSMIAGADAASLVRLRSHSSCVRCPRQRFLAKDAPPTATLVRVALIRVVGFERFARRRADTAGPTTIGEQYT